MESLKRERIAVIGTACRFPNNVNNIEEYWAFLKKGGDAVSEIPKSRWDWKFHFDEEVNKIGKSYVNRASFMDWDIESFDAAFFDISPREAAVLDPQQRLLLEVTFEALEDSVGDISTLRGSQTGVYIGCFMQDNLITQMGSGSSKSQLGTYTAVSSTMTMISNRLSYSFDLQGPSITMDTACSSSLVAIHQACRGLLAGDCNMAVTGGVNVMFRPEVMMMMSKGRFLARDGRSKTFSAHADGYGRGEGAGIIVLKRYADAIRDGDTIHGVIMGSGVNQDGNTDGITVPSESSQKTLARHVYQEANINPDDIAYLEAHGTGTPVGDPIEMRAMGHAVQRSHDKNPLIVGSVKAGIGHLEAAAGIAGFLKSLLIAKHGEIPPQASLDKELNPAIDFEGLHLRIADKLQPIPSSNKGKSYIAINSFGYGGTNAHVVLSKTPLLRENSNKLLKQTLKKLAKLEAFSQKHLSLHISAASEPACIAYAQTYLAQLEHYDHAQALQLCRDVTHKTQLTHRWVINADSVDTLKERLLLAIKDKKGDGIIKNRTHHQQKPVLVFSGMGPQWWAMGHELMKTEPLFASTLQDADKIFVHIAGWSILDEMMQPESESRIYATEIAQPANFMLQLGLFELLKSWGVKPSAVIGHSVGEVSSAYASGSLSLEDALRVSYHRSRTQAKTAGTGTMVATALNQADAKEYLQELESRLPIEQHGKVSLAGINSASNTTMSGDEIIIDQIIMELEAKNIFARKLRVEVPYHSAGMDPILEELATSLADVLPQKPTIPLYSTVSGELAKKQGFDAQYWCDNVRDPVYFEEVIDNLLASGHELFLEVGPHPVLSGYIKESILKSSHNGTCFSTLKRKEPEMECLSETISLLWASGVETDFISYIGIANPQANLPAYPWQRKKHWSEAKYDKEVRQGWSDAHPLLGRRLPDPTPSWESELSPSVMAWLPDHTVGKNIVFPGAGYIDTLLAATQEASKTGGNKILKNIDFHRALLLDHNEDMTLKTTLENGNRINIYAGAASKQDHWQCYASADLLSGRYAEPVNPLVLMNADQLSRFEPVSTDTLYANFNDLGLDYGSHFRSIKSLKRLGKSAIIDLEIEKDPRHIIHPALLDGAFQSMLALLEDDAGSAYLPVHIDEIHLYHQIQDQAKALLTITAHNKRYIKADLSLIVNNNVAVELLGIRCDAVQLATDPLLAELETVSYRLGWYLVGYDDDIVACSKVAIIGDHIPTGLDEGLVELGCEDVSLFDSIEAFSAIDNINDVEQLIVFIHTETAAEAMNESAKMVMELQILHSSGFSGTLSMITQEALAAEVRHSLHNWSSAWVTGLRRCAHNELAPITLRHIDIDDSIDGYALALEVSVDNAEDEVALQDNERWAMQITRVTKNDYHDLQTNVQKPFIDSGHNSFVLKKPEHPSIKSLSFSEDQRTAPLKGQIEIKVNIVSLNYKDISKVNGMLTEDLVEMTNSGMTLGLECEGIVVRIGEGVSQYSVGDKVAVATADSFRRYLTVFTDPHILPIAIIQKQPSHFKAGESAASFVAYGTALWGLKGVARLCRGETVLIHGAAGGVGLAALHIAKYLGAVIIASAGTEEKRNYLLNVGADHVVDSRTLNFVSTIKTITKNKGVDVVFNSVGGGIVPASIEALASFGRFIEIGKSDMFMKAKLDLALFEKGVSYTTLDLDYLVLKQPDYFFALMDKVFKNLSNGNLPPLAITTFGANNIQEAFTFLAKSQQIGKVCIDMNATPLVSQYTLRGSKLDPKKCVVITGGLGGIGLMIANWCIDNGANKIVLLGRNGASSASAQKSVQTLQSRDTVVDVYACDVSDFTSLNDVFNLINKKWVIGGIVHGAGTLEDCALLELDESMVKKVALPKIMGINNLHQLTKDNTALDFFWALSSVASPSGNLHQTNYALANSFMDGLMESRQAAGLPGNSIQLGPVGNVGMAMVNDDLKQYLALRGMHYMEEDLMHATFSRVMEWNIPIMTMVLMEWSVWEFAEPRAANSYRCEVIIAEEGADKSNDSTVDAIRQLPAEQRAETVGYILIEHIADILQMETEDIELDAPLDGFGIDSLTAVELQALINRSLHVEMSILSMLGGKTILAIAEELVELMNLTKDTQAVAEQHPPTMIKAIAKNSEEEVVEPLVERQAS